MNTLYRDIPKEERKQLAKEALRLNPRLHAIWYASMFVPILFSRDIANSILPKNGPFLTHLAVDVTIAVILCLITGMIFVRPRLKMEIEKLRNASACATYGQLSSS